MEKKAKLDIPELHRNAQLKDNFLADLMVAEFLSKKESAPLLTHPL